MILKQITHKFNGIFFLRFFSFCGLSNEKCKCYSIFLFLFLTLKLSFIGFFQFLKWVHKLWWHMCELFLKISQQDRFLSFHLKEPSTTTIHFFNSMDTLKTLKSRLITLDISQAFKLHINSFKFLIVKIAIW